MKKLLTTFTIILVVLIAGCKKDDYVETIGVCPLVISTDPVNGANSVPYNKVISAKFNEKMDASTINESSFTLLQGTTVITGVVSYTDSTAKFTPSAPLQPFTSYKATIRKTVKDTKGNLLQADYVWNFTTMPQITLISSPVIGGTTVGGGAYAVGATVTVTATPLPGYAFVNWTENGTVVSLVNSPLKVDAASTGTEVSTSSSYQFTMVGNRTLTANFAVVVLGNFAINLSSNPAAGGTTAGAGSYQENSTRIVSASPNTGYTFTSWTQGGLIVSTSPSYTFTLTANTSLVANFLINTYTLSVNGVNGTVAKNPNLSLFDYGTIVQLTPTPSVGYSFTSWTGDASGASNPLAVTMDANKVITANFTLNSYSLNVTATNGSVAKSPNQSSYNHGTSVQLTATPNSGYTFSSWSGDATGSTNPLTVNMTSNKNITANFTPIVGSLTLNVTAVNGVVVKNPDLLGYVNGASVQLTATPNPGYTFTSWSGDATGSTNPLTVNMNSNKNITANFTAIAGFTLNVSAVNGVVVKNPDLAGYASGASVQLTATPNSGYTFTSWSGDASGTSNPVTVIMNSNKNVTANFTVAAGQGPGTIDLGGAGIYTVLSKTGISTTVGTQITGNIGVSPNAATGITGFGLIMDPSNVFSKSSPSTLVSGKVYAADYAVPTPVNISTAVSDMETAFTTANGLTTTVITELGAGNITGMTLAPGLYKWSTGLLISASGVTLTGNANDTWVFQIAQGMTVANGANIHLAGGAQAKNIYWITASDAVIGSTVNFSGNILSQTLISINTGSTVTGRLLGQTAVTLNAATVIFP